MAIKKVKQFRYYNDAEAKPDGKNYPEGLTKSQLVSGDFIKKYTPIKQLGIQAFPGAKFYINNSDYVIEIGNTGIYELELNTNTEVQSLLFDAQSLSIIEESQTYYLIVDILYEEKEG